MGLYQYPSVFKLVESQANERPKAVAIESAGAVSISYLDLFYSVKSFIKALKHEGVTRGSRVAIVLPNGPELALSMLGVSSIATSVPLNPAYRKDEFKSYFNEIGVKYLLTLRNFETEARRVALENGIAIIELSDDGKMSFSRDGKQIDADFRQMPANWESGISQPDDLALILLTSGSTGRSKKVPLTHRNICTSVADICGTLQLVPADRCLCMWEQFHVGGLVDLLLVPLASGGAVICAGGFNAELFYELVASKKPTWFQGVPTTLNDLAVYAKRYYVNLRAGPLRFIRSVASSLSPMLMQEIEDLFGVPVLQTFGMTEAGPLITTNQMGQGKRKPGSVGQSCGPDIRIVSPEGRDLPPGKTGEIVIRGANVISGYEDAPEANAHSFRDGWFHTGDTGYLDDESFLYLTGRIKEMINRGGEKITPQEIDDILLMHPAISQAASFSVKHRTLGEDVGAAVVLRTPGSINDSDIRAFVADHLATFKVPQKVIILDKMPRDPIGKINRLSLALLAEAQSVKKSSEAGNASEQRVAAIWSEELELAEVDLDSNFFAVGGDSLSALRILLSIEESFGRQLPPNVFSTHGTVRKMTGLMMEEATAFSAGVSALSPNQEGRPSEAQIRRMAVVMGAGQIPVIESSPTIKIANPDGKKKPLVFCFNSPDREMAGLVPFLDPEQPLLGLFSGSRQLPNTDDMIQKIAAHYTDKILEIYPGGDFSLGGTCRGARITHQILRNLLQRGVHIDKVCFLQFFDPSLYEHDGKTMLLFGKHSYDKSYKEIGLTRHGWIKRFKRRPIVDWVNGQHGLISRPHNAIGFAAKLSRFLDDALLSASRYEKFRFYGVLALHRIAPIFFLYVKAHKLRTSIMYGKQKKKRK